MLRGLPNRDLKISYEAAWLTKTRTGLGLEKLPVLITRRMGGKVKIPWLTGHESPMQTNHTQIEEAK